MVTAGDKAIVRELAKQVKDLAGDEVNKKRIARSRAMHSLKPGRPLVWIDEIPWHEMDIDGALALRCETKEGAGYGAAFPPHTLPLEVHPGGYGGGRYLLCSQGFY